jgi:hypothetical protein
MEGRLTSAYNELLRGLQRSAADSLRVYRADPGEHTRELLVAIAAALRTTTHVRGRHIQTRPPAAT